MTLLVIFIRQLGPYHIARFSELSKVFQVHVIVTRFLSKEYGWEPQDNFPFAVHNICGKNFDSDPNIFKIFRILGEIRTINKDIILFVPGWSDFCHYVSFVYSYIFGLRLIVATDSNFTDCKRNFFYEYIKRSLLMGASGLLSAGTLSKQYLILLGIPRWKIREPWDVVDNSFFRSQSNLRNLSEKNYILCVSRNLEKKNIPFLISEYSKYKSNGGICDLVIVGVDTGVSKLMDFCETVDIAKTVQILPFMQKDNLKELFHGCRLFVLPSVYDQWGLVVNEAMSSGAPCIISERCGCAKDLIIHNKTGWKFDPYQPGSLYNLLLKSDDFSQSYLLSIAHAAFLNLENRFTLRHFKDSVLSLSTIPPNRSFRSVLTSILLLLFKRY